MEEDQLIEQCEQLVLLRSEINQLKKLEKELSSTIKESFGERGIIRDGDGRRVCRIASRRNPKLGVRIKFFKPWARSVLQQN